MNELKLLTGGKHTYGDDIINAQLETLEPLQGYFKQFGAVLIDGCAITANVGTPANFDIAAGIVAIDHADGFKIARFAGETNVVLPGYFTIDKEEVQGNYGQSGSVVVKDIAHVYTAVFNTGAPVAGNDTELVIPKPVDGSIQTFIRAAGAKSIITTTPINTTVFTPGQAMNFWINEITRTLHMKATIIVRDYANLSETAWPLSQTNLPAHMRPASKQMFLAIVDSSTSYPFVDSNNRDYIRAVPGYIDANGGQYLHIIKANNGAQYTVNINAIMHLD